MGGVVHRWKPRPISRPSFHVLLVAGFEKLQLAEFALVMELFHEQKFAGINHGFHHHVVEAGLGAEFNDGFAVLLGSRHGHRAGDMLAGAQSS